MLKVAPRLAKELTRQGVKLVDVAVGSRQSAVEKAAPARQDDDDEEDAEGMAEALENEGFTVINPAESLGSNGAGALGEAAVRWRRGEIAEALIYLERALPLDFSGLGDLLNFKA